MGARLITPLLLALVVIAVLLAVVWTLQRRMMYFPFGEAPPPAALGLAGVEEVVFGTADDGVRLGGWFFPVDGEPRGAVLVFNGNGGNRAYRTELATALRARGFQVLLFDYRGYGGNPGSPTEDGLRADARAARAYVTGRGDVDAARLVYFGESLGASVATELTTEHPPAALILRSPFTSMADIGQYHYPWLPVRLLLRDRYETLDAIRRVRAPLLVIAGDRDGIVPIGHSRRVYDAATEPKTFVTIPGADHNDLELLAGERMMRAILAFLDSALDGGRSR